jgi:hypothetical protein
VTTPYDDLDRRALVGGIEAVLKELDGGERLSFRTIEDSFARSARVLETCFPGCPDGAFGDLFSQCTEGRVIQDKKALRGRVVNGIGKRLAEATELPHSEIVRTLAISASEEYREGRPNRFFMFSDMIENSEHLPGREFFSVPNETLIGLLADKRLIPNLMGAEIVAFGIGRGGAGGREGLPQDRLAKLQDFWDLFFRAAGASATLRQTYTVAD